MAQWQTVDTVIGYDGFGEIDPYLDWAFPHIRTLAFQIRQAPTPRYPVLVRLIDGRTAQDFVDGTFFSAGAKPTDWADVVHVPAVYREGIGAGSPRYFTALVTKDFLDYFRKPLQPHGTDLVAVVERMCVSDRLIAGTEVLPFAGPSAPAASVPTGSAEAGTVVVGMIDDGIAFANQRFRTPSGRCRVESIWLQDGKANPGAARYGYGRSLTKAGAGGLDDLLATSTYSGLVDEDEVYKKAGALDFGPRGQLELRTVALRASHGTHVMDLACGYQPGHAPRTPQTKGEDSRPIVCVQLPAATSEGTSGASLDTHVVDGIRYILDKADEIARARGCGRLPVVINLSYGTIAGRHDGTSDLERAIDELIEQRQGTSAPVQMVIAAGNSRLLKCHSVVDFKPDPTTAPSAAQIRTMKWRVPPNSRAAAHLEIWLPQRTSGTGDRIKVRVKPPLAPWSPQLGEDTDDVHVLIDDAGGGVCELRYSTVPAPTSRGVFVITLKPTEPIQHPGTQHLDPHVAPIGLWQIEIENIALGADDLVHAWIQRNDTRFGYLPFGRQSTFEDDAYVERGLDGRVPAADTPASRLKRAGTLNAIAMGRHVVVVGAYERKGLQPTDYSGEGGTLSNARKGPDVLAPGDDSLAHGGVMASGTRSGSRVALNGTSVAAPRVTRLIADLMAQGLPADRNTIRALAWSEEAGRPAPPSEERGGMGRIEFPNLTPVQRIET